MTVEVKNASSGQLDAVDKIIRLGSQIIQETYGFERPQRPQRFNYLIDAIGEVLTSRYGPQAFNLNSDHIHWVSREEFTTAYEESKGGTPLFLKNSLESVGIKDFGETSIGENDNFFSLGDSENVEIYILADAYGDLGHLGFLERTKAEHELACKLITHSIFYSTIPIYCSHSDALIEILEKRIERDQRSLIASHPQMDREGFDKLVENLKFIANNDETKYVILNGAKIILRHTVYQKTKDSEGKKVDVPHDEALLADGGGVADYISRWLAYRSLQDFLKIWVQSYPHDAQTQKALTVKV